MGHVNQVPENKPLEIRFTDSRNPVKDQKVVAINIGSVLVSYTR